MILAEGHLSICNTLIGALLNRGYVLIVFNVITVFIAWSDAFFFLFFNKVNCSAKQSITGYAMIREKYFDVTSI